MRYKIKIKDSKQYKVIITDDNEIKYTYEEYYKLEKRIAPIFEAIINNQVEISDLIKQRNELLPLLMNGQVNFDLLVWYDILYYLYIRV